VTVIEERERAADVWHRVLVLAPIGRDAELIGSVLGDASIDSARCENGEELCRELAAGAGGAIIAEEVLDNDMMNRLGRTLAEQPAWSDMPIMILTGQPLSIPARPRSFSKLGRRASITLVDRPVRMKTLVTTTESLLRFRDRQYEIRDLLEKLEERVHERDRFLAILGHELRNPLGAILLATQMTRDDGCLDAEHVVRIERQSRHLTRLVNDLLDLSRVTSGKISLKRSIVNFTDAVKQCLATMQTLMEERGQRVTFEEPVEPLFIDGDPTRVEQVATNILMNAMKYTPEGGEIHVAVEKNDHQAVLRVRDNGVGIAPERLTMIFELFGQAENAIGRSQGGMGIGLALVRNLVELHGGTVSASSDGVGHGSEFTVRLPLASADAIAAHVPRIERRVTGSLANVARRIVVVEDNPDVRDLLKMKLKRLGHHVESASDGHSGLAKVLKDRPDVAFVDIGLPGIDGYEIAHKVRAALGESIILVALSGFGQPDDKRRAMESGFDQHLTKPVELRDIEAVLARNRDEC
jgi:signal transduction histidine kinase